MKFYEVDNPRDWLKEQSTPSYHAIPDHLLFSLHRYVRHGVPTGDALYGLLTSDLYKFMYHADDYTIAALKPAWKLLYNHFPCDAWGSPEKVSLWISGRGWEGYVATATAAKEAAE